MHERNEHDFASVYRSRVTFDTKKVNRPYRPKL
nr:MAG TPA: hypothetical protein [Siphoviridae sp. ctELO16]